MANFEHLFTAPSSEAPSVETPGAAESGTPRFANLFTDPNEGRTLGEHASDLAASYGIGSNALLSMGGTLYGLATGHVDNWATRQGEFGKKWWQDKKTAQLLEAERRRDEKIAAGEDEWDKAGSAIWETLSSPSLLSTFLVEQIPLTLAGGAAGKAAQVAGGGAKTVAGTAYGTGAALTGADSAQTAREQLNALPDKLWLKNPMVEDLMANGASQEDAIAQAKLSLSRNAFATTAAVSLATNLVPGATKIENVLTGAKKAGSGSRLVNAGKGALGEGLQETIEEGTTQLAANVATQQVDPDQRTFEGVGQAVGLGLLAGSALGGAAGAAQPKSLDEARKEIHAEVEKELEAAGLIPDSERAPIGEPVYAKNDDGTTTVTVRVGANEDATITSDSNVAIARWLRSLNIEQEADPVQEESAAVKVLSAPSVDEAIAAALGANMGVEEVVAPAEESVDPEAAIPEPEPYVSEYGGTFQEFMEQHLNEIVDEMANKRLHPRRLGPTLGPGMRSETTDDAVAEMITMGGGQPRIPSVDVDVQEDALSDVPQEPATPGGSFQALLGEYLEELRIDQGTEQSMVVTPEGDVVVDSPPVARVEAPPLDKSVPESNYVDPRLKRKFHRDELASMAKEVKTQGRRSMYMPDQRGYDEHGYYNSNSGLQARRVPSSNPYWFKDMNNAPYNDLKTTAKDLKTAVRKALAGQTLGVKQERIVVHMLDLTDGWRRETAWGPGDDHRNAILGDRALRSWERQRGIPRSPMWNTETWNDMYTSLGKMYESQEYERVEGMAGDEDARKLYDLSVRVEGMGGDADGIMASATTTEQAYGRLIDAYISLSMGLEPESEFEFENNSGVFEYDREEYDQPGEGQETAEVGEVQPAEPVAEPGPERVSEVGDIESNAGQPGATSETTARLTADAIEVLANESAESEQNDRPKPTEAQKEAGNYKKGAPFTLHGMNIVVENPKGSTRSGVGPDGVEWSSVMGAHYGDIKRTEGADGDSLDVFVGDNPESELVWVIDQIDQATGEFDEHKIMMGFATQEDALAGYLASYDEGWRVGPVTQATVSELSEWVNAGATTLPFGGSFEAVPGVSDEAAQVVPDASEGTESPTEVEAARDNEPDQAEVDVRQLAKRASVVQSLLNCLS